MAKPAELLNVVLSPLAAQSSLDHLRHPSFARVAVNHRRSGVNSNHDSRVHLLRPDDIRLSLNEAPEIHDRVRPSYPSDLFDTLFAMVPAEPKIVEIGQGTGQATNDLLARGASVLAIEIGPATAATLRSNLPSNRLRVRVGDFEVIVIQNGEADAVFSAGLSLAIRSLEKHRPIAPQRFCDRAAWWRLSISSKSTRQKMQTLRRCPPDLRTFWSGPYRTTGAHCGTVDPAIPIVLDVDSRFNSVAVRRYDCQLEPDVKHL
jgi:SAM-dependent methyltransferase